MSCTWMPTKSGKTSNLIYESLETGSLLFFKRKDEKWKNYGFLTQKNLDR